MSEVFDDGSCWEAGEVESDDVPEVIGSEAMFKEFVGRARELPEDAVVVFKGNASIVFTTSTEASKPSRRIET